MARQRRGGGGFKTPELRGTLGTLLRTTRDMLERGARQGRERLDEALASRRREGLLAELGEVVLELIRAGEIDVGELPEAREIVARLDDLDSEHPPEDDAPAAPAPRERFDRRPRRDDDGTVTASTWAPPTRKKQGGSSTERVWRPPASRPTDEPPARERPAPRGAKKGGITFDDDSDLADYMHPDDVPPKDPSSGKS
jgi:hypothetical protein